MCVAFQKEELPLIGEDVLNPQTSRIWMWRGLVHNRNIRTGNRAVGRNNDCEIWLARQLVAEAEAQVVPHDTYGYLSAGNIGKARACWCEVAFSLQLSEEIDTWLNVVEAATRR